MIASVAPRNAAIASRTASAATIAAGITLVACAIYANQGWLDQHFLPSFLLPRAWFVRIQTTIQIAMAIAGTLVLVVRPWIARIVASNAGTVLRVAVAALLAIGASEAVLRSVHLRSTWIVPTEEPLRRADPRLGWTYAPNHVGRGTDAGRTIEYAIDGAGFRVRSLEEPVDPERPTIVFTGESVMFGDGLTWDESIPAEVGRMLGTQAANLAVSGYSSDQAYLRLQEDLPRFKQPVAVVSLFMTALFSRNLHDERPHLGPGLIWRPPVVRWRLASLARLLIPYHHREAIEEGVAVIREILRATANLARARGAAALIVMPQLRDQTAPERALRQRIMDRLDVPAVLVEVPPEWHLAGDPHPDARGARLIAEGIANRLRHRER